MVVVIAALLVAAVFAGPATPVVAETARIDRIDMAAAKRKARRNAHDHCVEHADMSQIFNYCVDWDAGPCYKEAEPDRGHCNADYVIAIRERNGYLHQEWYCAATVYMKQVGAFVRVTKPRPVYQCIPLGDKP